MVTSQEHEHYPDGIPPHILIMEDETVVAKGLEMVLSEEGYDVDLAYCGKEALETFSAERFDLLVADLRLPDIDGMEVIKTVKDRNPDTEVVIITGYSSVNSAVQAMKIGVFDYLTKPFTDDEIKHTVYEALKKIREVESDRIQDKVSKEEFKLIEKREVLRVLDRTADDRRFWQELMEDGADALESYHLSAEAKAAVASGDLGWINRNIGELTQKQLLFIYSRLEREAW